MKTIGMVMVLCCGMALAGENPSERLVGVWHGTLDAGSAKLRMRIKISKEGDTLKALLDSLDQGAMDLPFEVTFPEGKVAILSKMVGGGFTGTLSEDGNTLTGHWSQNSQRFPLTFQRKQAGEAQPEGLVVDDAQAARVLGKWQGTLNAGIELRLVITVERAEDKSLVGNMVSIDQSPRKIPIRIDLPEGGMTIKVPAIQGSFEGTFSEDNQTLSGDWKQAGNTLPLSLERNEDVPKLNRPQEPKQPYPYLTEEVSFTNKKAEVTLAGTLTLPKGDGPFPAAILVTGSGPQNRDEELLGHKPFLVLADHLTRKGIAVLRYDDRGTAQSTGTFQDATTSDFCDDALAGVAWLKTHPKIDKKMVGIVGHSEGGLIAPMAAARSKEVNYVVLMAGPAVPGAEIIIEQSALIMRAQGVDEETIALGSKVTQQLFDILRDAGDEDKTEEMVAMLRRESAQMTEAQRTALGATEDQFQSQVERVGGHWFRYFLFHDPGPDIRQLSIPTLALFGSTDLQVPPKQSADVMRAALKASATKDYKVVVFPKLNHLFQTSETGNPADYAKIEETIAPEALNTISSWINNVAGRN